MNTDFATEQKKSYIEKSRRIIAELPPFAKDFFRGIANNTLARTQYAYALDLRLFFNFLVNNIDDYKTKTVLGFTLTDMDSILPEYIEEFLSNLSLYESDGHSYTNIESSKARKLSSLRSFFKYFIKRGILKNAAAEVVTMPKIREKNIIRLEPDEMARLLDAVQDPTGLTKKQAQYHKLTETRDLAILTLFLGTGLRISELIGIDMDDIDFISSEIAITRKGGNQSCVVFGDEVNQALLQYMLQRETMTALEGHEKAMFLSTQRKRISVAAVENLVKKYANIAVPSKKISPHKLRSSYGTALYEATSDLYLVADALGHKDINVTKKHYTELTKAHKRVAAQVVKLRT